VRAWLGAPLVQASLVLVGLRSTLRWIEGSGSPTSPSFMRRASPIGVAEGSDLVRSAFRAHVVGGECLPQSLVQYLLHRQDGLSVRLVVGVRRVGHGHSYPGDDAPIAAHAWIEDDSTAGDPAFAPLFVAGPARAERCAA